MANHVSAAKRHRQSLKRAARNRHIRATVRNAIRKVRAAAESGDASAPELLHTAETTMRKATSKGVYHKRTTSRTISRLAKLVQKA
jgi:small subunit ribosomal protein S20